MFHTQRGRFNGAINNPQHLLRTSLRRDTTRRRGDEVFTMLNVRLCRDIMFTQNRPKTGGTNRICAVHVYIYHIRNFDYLPVSGEMQQDCGPSHE